MKTNGYIRKVDDLGRIVIPKEVRKNLKISENDVLEIFSDSSSIIIKKQNISCILCGSKRNLIVFNEKNICKNCIKKLEEHD